MWLALPFAYLAAAVLGHAVLTRVPLPMNVVARFLVVGGLGGAALGVQLLGSYGPAVEAAGGLLVYALACEVYIFLFTLVSSSVSARLLLTLRSGDLDEAAIDARYSAAEMVDGRLAKLVANGFLVRDADGYALTPRGRRTVATFERLRRAFRHPERSPRREQPA
jgi:hypothetical protein